MSKDLRIQVVAELNRSLSKKELQNQLKSIEKDLKINIRFGLGNIKAIQKRIQKLQHSIRSLNHESNNLELFSGVIRNNNNSQATVGEAQQNKTGIRDMFSTAFKNYTLPQAINTSFNQLVRTGKEFIDILVNVDTHITNLKKVMDNNTDFSGMLEIATVQAKDFAKSLDTVFTSYEEFAQQGYNQKEIEQMSQASSVASNVSELDAGTAAEYLTSALTQFKLETKDAMLVIDAWNEISNNNATTLQKMAEGYAVAGSTMYNFGMDMHQANAAIGTVTATTKQSGEEIGNFLKNVLPRILSTPAQGALDMIGVSTIDSTTGDTKEAVKIYEEVAKKYQSLSKIEKAIVSEGLAGIQYSSEMTAWLDNWDMYEKMLSESMGSAGSAMEENGLYMDSLQAKINVLRVEFEMLAISLGEAFLSDAVLAFISTTTTALNTLSSIVSTIGGLPTILMASVPAFILLNKGLSNYVFMSGASATASSSYVGKLRELVAIKRQLRTTTTHLTSALSIFSLSTSNATAKLERQRIGLLLASTAVRGLAVAFRGLVASTGIGLAFLGVGLILEKTINHFSTLKREAEEEKAAWDNLADTYSKASSEIDKLSARYEELTGKQNLTVGEQKELNDIQNKLNQLMPSFTKEVDDNGDAHLRSAEAIKLELEYLKALNKERAQEKVDEFSGNLNERIKKMKEHQEKIDKLSSPNREKQISFSYGGIGVSQKEIDEQKAKDNLNIEIAEAGLKKELFDIKGDVKNYVNDLMTLSGMQDELNEKEKLLINTYLDKNLAMISANEVIEDNEQVFSDAINSAKEYAEKIIQLRDILGEDFDISLFDKIGIDITTLTKEQAEALKNVNDEIKKGGEDWSTYAEQLKKVDFKEVEEAVEGLRESYGKLSQAFNIGLFSDSEGKTPIPSIEIAQEMLNQGIPVFMNYNGLIFDYIEGMSLASIATYAQESAMESLFTAYEDASHDVSILNELLEKMAEGKQISAHEAMGLIKEINELADAISIENGQVKINEEAVKSLRDVKISSNNKMIESVKNLSIVTAQSIAANMTNYGLEIGAIKDLASAKEALAKMDAKVYENPEYVDPKLYQEWIAMQDAVSKIEQIEQVFKLASKGLEEVGKSTEKASKSTDKNTKSNKANIESIKDSTYYANEYKNKLEDLRLELEEINQTKSKYPSYHKEYLKALDSEIDKQKEILELHKEQKKDLENQIKTRDFKQTGMVTKDVSTGSASTTKLSGWDGKVTSERGMRNGKMHHGIDIAGATGTRLDSNVAGKVVYSGWGKSGTGYGDYGNVVAIQTSDGNVHLYAHLDKVMAGLGDYVEVGNQLGTIGNTGNSRGSHLHYEIRKGGQLYNTIDPNSYVASAKAGTDSSTSKNSGQKKAVLDEKLDQLRSELNQTDSDIIRVQEIIDNLQLDRVNAELSKFTHLREGADRSIQRSQQKIEEYSISSKMYRDEIEKQNKQKLYQIDLFAKEAEHIRKQLEREDLSVKVKEELEVKLSEVIIAYHEFNAAVKENNKLYEDSLRLERFVNKMEDLDYELQVSKGLMSLVNEESEEFTDHLIKQDKIWREKLKLNREEIKRLSELASTYREGEKPFEETIKLIRQLTLESISYNNELQNLQETTKKLAQDKLNTITNVERKVIEMIKHRINEEKKVLQDNLKEYENYINEKIRILRKEHEEEDWEKSLQKEQEELIKLNAEYNKRMLDDSLASRNKQRELKKSIEEQEEKIREMLRKKGLDKQIENLEQLLKEEQEVTEDKLSELDKQLENDKLYMEARKAIESGYLKWYTIETRNVQGLVRSEFIETTRTLESAYIEFEDRFGEGMSILGEKIKSDFIENIKLAQQSIVDLSRLIKESSFDIGIGSDFTPVDLDVIGKDKVEGRPEQNLSSDDLNLLWAKFINDKVMTDSKVKSSQGSMRSFDKMKDTVISWIGDRSSTIDPDNTLNFDRAFSMLESDQKQQVLDYIRKMMFSNNRVEDPVNISVIEDLLKHMVRLNTGGYLKGIGKQGGLAIVDDKELVLNQADTKNILETVKESRLLTSLKPSNLSNIIKQANPLQGIDLSFDKIIHVEGNLDSATMPKVQSAIKNAFSDLGRSFNMSGVFRRI